MKSRLIYLSISGIIIAVGVYSTLTWGFNLSIDFTGGTIVEYRKSDGSTSVERFGPISQEEAKKPDQEIVRFETVGPTLSQEILRRTVIGVVIATIGILAWVAWQFKSIQFGVSAVLAMIHDSLVLIGLFSLLGYFYKAQVDTLFVTALLTTLAFSVHDTIVVFDRIREMRKRIGGSIYDLANLAVSQTMVRSLNNSLTIIFVLVALALLGGSNIFWFIIALLIGTVTGTYSSPFVAVPLLVTWDEVGSRLKNKLLRSKLRGISAQIKR